MHVHSFLYELLFSQCISCIGSFVHFALQLVDTTVEIANKVGGAEIVSRVVEDLKDENEQFRKMVMDCLEKVRDILPVTLPLSLSFSLCFNLLPLSLSLYLSPCGVCVCEREGGVDQCCGWAASMLDNPFVVVPVVSPTSVLSPTAFAALFAQENPLVEMTHVIVMCLHLYCGPTSHQLLGCILLFVPEWLIGKRGLFFPVALFLHY